MQLGMKVETGRVGEDEWLRQFGSADRLLRHLSEAGADFAEFPLGDDTQLDTVRAMGHHAADAGLAVSLHPYLHHELAPEIFDASRSAERLREILQLAQDLAGAAGQYVSMVFHGGVARYWPHEVDYDQAVRAGQAFFRFIDAERRLRFPDVRPYAETQLPHDATDRELVRLGDTYGRVLELIEGTDVEVCWDFGHAWRSVLLKKHPVQPPPWFLDRVGHVHLHDAYADETDYHDHQPLGGGDLPWAQYLATLAGQGYDGRILLEVALRDGATGYGDISRLVRDTRGKVEAVFAQLG